MRKIIFIIAFLFVSPLIAQELTPKSVEKVFNYTEVDAIPEFPNGINAFYKFIGNNFRTPEEEGLKGMIKISFIIEKDGSISDIKVLKDLGYGAGAEAIRVLKISGSWIPAKIAGKPVRFLYNLPIMIQSAE